MNLNYITKYISSQIHQNPRIGLILGSGLNYIANSISNKIIIPYDKIPSFYKTTVKGHKGEFIYGEVNNTPILVLKVDFIIMKDIVLMKLDQL